MKKPESQLKSIAKNLAALADKLEKISAQVESTPAKAAAKPAPKKAAGPKKAESKPKKKEAAKKKAPAGETGKDTVLESVYDVISKSRNGATIASLRSKTGLESRQLSNALYKLGKKGQIKTISRGVYVKA